MSGAEHLLPPALARCDPALLRPSAQLGRAVRMKEARLGRAAEGYGCWSAMCLTKTLFHHLLLLKARCTVPAAHTTQGLVRRGARGYRTRQPAQRREWGGRGPRRPNGESVGDAGRVTWEATVPASECHMVLINVQVHTKWVHHRVWHTCNPLPCTVLPAPPLPVLFLWRTRTPPRVLVVL